MNYRRNYINGGCYFFTVNLKNRRQSYLTDHIHLLRFAVKKVRDKHPFFIDAWVVLPDHMHAIWSLPYGDSNFSSRWREIKKSFTKSVHQCHPSGGQAKMDIWQNRFWEHTIRNEQDFKSHYDYIHVNPLKHGLVKNVKDWPYSSFHRAVRDGVYGVNWCGEGIQEFSSSGYGERAQVGCVTLGNCSCITLLSYVNVGNIQPTPKSNTQLR